MTTLVTRSASLMPRPAAGTQTGFGTSYVFDGEAVGHLELGNLLVVIEVDTSQKAGEAIADLIIHTVGDQYYNQNTDSTPMERFESAIQTLNSELKAYTKQDDSWVGKLHAVVAVLASDGMHITNAGGSQALLVRGSQSVPIKAEAGKDGHYFASIASGKLKPSDKILLTTNALLHQVDEAKLPGLVSNSSPNKAVAELAALIGTSPGSERAAAVIAEVTTPETLSMMPLPSESNVAVAGPAPKWLDKARAISAPKAAMVVNSLKTSTQKATWAAQQHLLPRLKAGALQVAAILRAGVRDRHQRPKLWAGMAAVAAIILVFAIQTNASKAQTKLINEFNQAVATYNLAQTAFAEGNKEEAKNKLDLAKGQLDSISKSRNAAKLDKALRAKTHTEGEPGNLDELRAALEELSDSLEGLVRITPTIVVDFSTIKDSKPAYLEQLGTTIVAVDNRAVYTVSSGGQVKTAATGSFGTVVATAASGDSVFILTSEPAVWQFKPTDNSLAKVTLSLGDWPQGKDMDIYNGNLYILSDEQVHKFVPTLAGFSDQGGWLLGDAAADTKAATALAVDGSVYLSGGPKVLARYFAGNFTQSATSIPGTLTSPTAMRGNGSQLLTVSPSTRRFGLLTTSDDTLAFIRQFELKNQNDLVDVVYDAAAKTVYAITGNKLVKAPITF